MYAHDWTIVGVTTFVWLVLQVIAGTVIGTAIDRMGDGK
jgi:hypothetical protein